MIKNIINLILKKILWKLAKPASKFLFLTHKISYHNPFGEKPIVSNFAKYKENFEKSNQLENSQISKHYLFSKYSPDIEFIEKTAFTLQNVIKKTKNSYIHGYILYSYVSEYINLLLELEGSHADQINILDIGTARGFSSLCMAKSLDDNKFNGKIFTFDILPNRISFFWNSHVDLSQGKTSRLELLKPWEDIVNKYLIFFSTATFNSLRVVDIPKIHFAFIDGSHFFKDVIFEIKYIFKRLNENSILILDDYDINLFPGVVRACDYLLSLKLHTSFELIPIQNERKLAVFKFGLN
tara:strand:+ start:2305 stop:3192 length:888 start_codon:yes stop_codon:yes gene_type:complete